jgi:hypothetical protein
MAGLRQEKWSRGQCVFALFAFLFQLNSFGIVHPPASDTKPFRSDRILVKPKSSAASTLQEHHRLSRAVVMRRYPAIGGLEVVNLPGGMTVENALRAYRASGLVEYAEPDYLLRAARQPNDPRYLDASQWPLYNWGQLGGTADCDIDAPEAWDTLYDASSILVSVIDSGIRVTHEDLVANLWTNPGEI